MVTLVINTEFEMIGSGMDSGYYKPFLDLVREKEILCDSVIPRVIVDLFMGPSVFFGYSLVVSGRNQRKRDSVSVLSQSRDFPVSPYLRILYLSLYRNE